jgi:hypothetical protein
VGWSGLLFFWLGGPGIQLFYTLMRHLV